MTKKVFVTLIVLAMLACLVGCNDADKAVEVDYSKDNSFVSNIIDSDYALIYEPISSPEYVDGERMSYTEVNYTYGLIFYVGSAIEPSYYSYLAGALARQGYLVVIPKVKLNLAYIYYADYEEAFSNYPNVKFFVGGHSQGGGAAIRRSYENASSIVGTILYSPMAYRHKLVDENGNSVLDENNVEIYINDNLLEVDLPTLLLEAANDHVLPDSTKTDARARLKEGYTHHVISPGSHMSFSTMDTDGVLSFFNNDGDGMSELEKQAQRELTLQYTLAFMRSVITK